jgi:hypothetical protein
MSILSPVVYEHFEVKGGKAATLINPGDLLDV